MKILVIAMSGIGDTLIATPLLRELRANFPAAQIDVLVMWAGAKDLLEGNPNINRVWQKNLIKEGAVSSLPFLRQLRRERYDISINAHTQGRLAYRALAAFIGANRRVGHSYDTTGWLDRAWFMHAMVAEDYAFHSIENNNRLLTLIGGQTLLTSHEMEVFLTPTEERFAQEFASANRFAARRVLGVHVGSGGTKNLPLKRWPLPNYVELFKRLLAVRTDMAIVLIGGPEEREAHSLIRAEVPSNDILVPETKNLRQAAALLRHCQAFLSVDTALMHLAAAVKVPNQIVIEAMTLNSTNLPYGNCFKLVPNPAVRGRNLDYYRYDGRPIKGADENLIAAMNSVKVEAVQLAVAASLGF